MKWILLLIGGLATVDTSAQTPNDSCKSAIVITALDGDCFSAGNIPSDATPSLSFNPSCVPIEEEVMKDVWFTFTTQDSILHLEQILTDRGSNIFSASLYEGSCTDLEQIKCRFRGGTTLATLTLDHLAVGRQLFYRVAVPGDFLDDFQLCIRSSAADSEPEPCQSMDFVVTADTIIDRGSVIQLQALPLEAGPSHVLHWYVGDSLLCEDCPTVRVTPSQRTTYSVSLLSPGFCVSSKEIVVGVRVPDQDQVVFIPNGFSPNGDGINDRFTVFGGGGLDKVLRVEIYDRHGTLLYQSQHSTKNDPFSGWDGTYRDQKQDSGTYLYRIQVQFADASEQVYEGTVHLVR